jgi:succinate dehydrogenase / fumarate reductase cytochrome b subunit
MAPPNAPGVRPLSPHLGIYRWSWTMAMSVFHRGTAVVLYAGTALLALWLLSLASSTAFYDAVQEVFGSPLGLLVLFGYTWALLHHMLGGIRHLVWDFGFGMEPGTRFQLARLTLIGSVTLTLLIWVAAFFLR